MLAASVDPPKRPDRAVVMTAVRAGAGAGLATWLADVAGIPDAYWAGISAIVVAAPTVGANLGAALARVAATFAGLALGLAAHAAGGTGPLAAGIVAAVALVALPAAGLGSGARLGAATTLLVTVAGGSDDLGVAAARGLAIPLGCGVAILLGLVVLPTRAGTGLRRRLGADVAACGALVRDAVTAYAGAVGATPDLDSRLRSLRLSRRAHIALLGDAAHELGEDTERLYASMASAARLVDATADLVAIAREGGGDAAPAAATEQLVAVAEAVEAAAGAYAGGAAPARIDRLDVALTELDASLERTRAAHGLIGYPTAEVIRLLAAVRALHSAAAALRLLYEPLRV
jgi:uncharacterized membrane protein YccC